MIYLDTSFIAPRYITYELAVRLLQKPSTRLQAGYVLHFR